MPLEPRHPDEPALHHQLRDALNEALTNTNFFVWIDVVPTGTGTELVQLPQIVNDTEQWLASLDPEEVPKDDLPEMVWSDPTAEVRITAIPKKEEARDHRAIQIVGNPEPIIAGWLD
jgi:hypothetical protein